MYQDFKLWFLKILLPMHYAGVYIPFSKEMQTYDYDIASVIYWLYRNAGEHGKDYRLYSMMAGFPTGVRILDEEVATMFKLRFKV